MRYEDDLVEERNIDSDNEEEEPLELNEEGVNAFGEEEEDPYQEN